MSNSASLLTLTLYLFAVATLLVAFSKRFGLGSILGLLLAGVIVGPYSPGPILTKDVDTLRHITEFGVVLLLFVIGLEMQPKNCGVCARKFLDWEVDKFYFRAFLSFFILFSSPNLGKQL